MPLETNPYNVHDALYPEIEDLSQVLSIYNYVVVKPSRKETSYSSGEGLDLQMSTIEFSDNDKLTSGEHICVSGEVVRVPKYLSTIKDGKADDFMFAETTMDVREGDQVWYHFNADNRKVSPHDPMAFKYKGEVYIYIHYQHIFCGRREETNELYCCNGYLLFEPVDGFHNTGFIDQLKEMGFKPPGNIQDVNTLLPVGDLRYKGKPNIKDLSMDAFNLDIESDLVIGGRYLLDIYCNRPIESKMHLSLDGDRVLWFVERKHVVGFVE